jgi:hypothetical protein
MSARSETLELRLELLKLRAELERAELRAALIEIRQTTQGVRRVASLASGLGAAVAGSRAGGGLAWVAGVLSQRPWLAAIALRAWRMLRRHPLAGAALVAGATAAIVWMRSSATDESRAAPVAQGGSNAAGKVPE